MSTVAELDARAQELRAQGLTYREIGERMGESTPQAWRRCNREREREHTRAYKARNCEALREYDRRYCEEHRAVCPKCGHVYGIGSGKKNGPREDINFSQCPNCIRRRSEQIVAWWAGGLRLREIAERLGWSMGHIQAEFDRLRAKGYDLPYRNFARKFPHLRRAA